MENLAHQVCNICMEADLAKDIAGIVEPCLHTFCFSCIEKWLTFKKTCPNCLLLVRKLSKKSLHMVEEVELNFTEVQCETHETPNFDCLDHEYFRIEVKNLEKRLNKIVINLSKNKRDFDIENKWKLVEDIKKKIKSKMQIIENLDLFDAELFLNEIYDLDSLFKKIELNKWNEIKLEEYLELCQPKRYCDENNLILDETYYDEDYNEEEFDDQIYYGRKYSNQFEINNFKKTQQKATSENKKKKKKKNKNIEI